MKRPDAKRIRAELERRQIEEAQAMARSDAIEGARVAKAFDVFVDARDMEEADVEARRGASARR